MTYTYVTLDVSAAVYDEIAGKLKAAAYDQAFHEQADGSVVIDMHGIALKRESEPEPNFTIGPRSFSKKEVDDGSRQRERLAVDDGSPGHPRSGSRTG